MMYPNKIEALNIALGVITRVHQVRDNKIDTSQYFEEINVRYKEVRLPDKTVEIQVTGSYMTYKGISQGYNYQEICNMTPLHKSMLKNAFEDKVNFSYTRENGNLYTMVELFIP